MPVSAYPGPETAPHRHHAYHRNFSESCGIGDSREHDVLYQPPVPHGSDHCASARLCLPCPPRPAPHPPLASAGTPTAQRRALRRVKTTLDLTPRPPIRGLESREGPRQTTVSWRSLPRCPEQTRVLAPPGKADLAACLRLDHSPGVQWRSHHNFLLPCRAYGVDH